MLHKLRYPQKKDTSIEVYITSGKLKFIMVI